MKQAIFLFTVVLFSLVVLGCSAPQLEPIQAPDSAGCALACEDDALLQEKIQTYFDYAPGSYTLTCSSCNLSRGGFIDANIIKAGEPVELYYSWGWCSSGGSDCGWELSFTTNSGSDLYAPMAANYCNKITEYSYVNKLNCTGLEFDITEKEKSACFLGDYTIEQNGKRTLAISQISNRCDARVEPLSTI